VLIGPVAAVLLKKGVSVQDFVLCGVVSAAALIACCVPAAFRAVVLLSAITLTNIYAFGRFNPLQPAGPLFETPDTDVVRQLREVERASPDHILIDRRFLGGTANGMGFRSVAHALQAPRLDVFREYFPAMDAEQFNQVFNRYCYVQVTDGKLPNTTFANVVHVPREAFEPVRNLRQVVLEVVPRKDCSIQRGGAVDHVNPEGDRLIIEGWAPWQAEDRTQELRVSSPRKLKASLLTLKRPDVAETLKDYAFARAGFRLTLESADGKPLPPAEIVLVARNTAQGLSLLTGCGCP
jgi:hypothetical protein